MTLEQPKHFFAARRHLAYAVFFVDFVLNRGIEEHWNAIPVENSKLQNEN